MVTPATPAASDFYLQAQHPQPQDTQLALVTQVAVSFNQPLIANSDVTRAISLWAEGTRIDATARLEGTQTLTLTPAALLKANTQHRVTLSPGLMAEDGSVFAGSEWTFTTAGDVYTTSQAVIDLCMSERDIAMLEAVNEARTQARICEEDGQLLPAVTKLRWNCTLQAAATTHNTDMVTHDFFAHQGSDGSEMADRINRAGYRWQTIGENLAAGYPTAREAVEGLLTSPSHCVNIMFSRFSELGAAYGYSADTYYRHYWTQNFGSPAN